MAENGFAVRCTYCGSKDLRMTCEAKTRHSGWEFIDRTYHCRFCHKTTTRAGGGLIPKKQEVDNGR